MDFHAICCGEAVRGNGPCSPKRLEPTSPSHPVGSQRDLSPTMTTPASSRLGEDAARSRWQIATGSRSVCALFLFARPRSEPGRGSSSHPRGAETKTRLRRSSKGSSLAACDLCFPLSNAAGGPPTTRLTRLGGAFFFYSARASEGRADLAREWSPAVAPGSMPRLRRLCAGRLPADLPRGLNMVGAVFRLQYATCVRAPVSLLYSAGAFSFRARGVSLHGPRCV